MAAFAAAHRARQDREVIAPVIEAVRAAAIAAQILSETYDATAPSSARVARRTELAARLQ
jgi:hypothetical protein